MIEINYLYIGLFLGFFILLLMNKKYNNFLKEKCEKELILRRSHIEVINSDELSNFLKSMSLKDRLGFKSDFLYRYRLSPFADYHDIKMADLSQKENFQNFMKEHNFIFNSEITLKSNNDTMSYKPLKDFEKNIEIIEKQQQENPDKSFDKLSGNFRYGY